MSKTSRTFSGVKSMHNGIATVTHCRRLLSRRTLQCHSLVPLNRPSWSCTSSARLQWRQSAYSSSPRCQVRGVKSKTRVKLEDLPQGQLEESSVVVDAQDEGPSYPTVIQQARNNMRKFENCIVLTRVGGFYELYFEQAEQLGPLLSLKVATKRTNAGAVPMVNNESCPLHGTLC